jgi:hypothetical protein
MFDVRFLTLCLVLGSSLAFRAWLDAWGVEDLPVSTRWGDCRPVCFCGSAELSVPSTEYRVLGAATEATLLLGVEDSLVGLILKQGHQRDPETHLYASVGVNMFSIYLIPFGGQNGT